MVSPGRSPKLAQRKDDGVEGFGGHHYFLPDVEFRYLIRRCDDLDDEIGAEYAYDEYDVRGDHADDLSGHFEFPADLSFPEDPGGGASPGDPSSFQADHFIR